MAKPKKAVRRAVRFTPEEDRLVRFVADADSVSICEVIRRLAVRGLRHELPRLAGPSAPAGGPPPHLPAA